MFKLLVAVGFVATVSYAAIFRWDGLTMNFNEPEKCESFVILVELSEGLTCWLAAGKATSSLSTALSLI
jgi:hypothetical protein